MIAYDGVCPGSKLGRLRRSTSGRVTSDVEEIEAGSSSRSVPCSRSGGMAVVYLAEHDWLQRKVALKVLAPQLAEDERFRDRFIRGQSLHIQDAYRAIAKSPPASPPATILPLGSRAIPHATSKPPANLVCTKPFTPKEVSREPSGMYRARANLS